MTPSPQSISLTLDTPEGFHELPLQLPPDVLDAALWELAGRVWPGGTDFQRETTAIAFADLTEALTTEGVLHASVALYETADGEPSTAQLLVRAQAVEAQAPEVVAASFQEVLSLDEHRNVARVDLPCGPAVLSLHATETDDEAVLAGLAFAHIELYVPAPTAGWLLVLALSTPCFADLPRYTSIMRQIGESLVIGPADQAGIAESSVSQDEATDVSTVFG